MGLESKQFAEFLMFLSLCWQTKGKIWKAALSEVHKERAPLTSTTDVDQQISLENRASLQHLCRCDRVDGLCFPILTDLGARPLTRAAEHAVRKEKETGNKQQYTTLSLGLLWVQFWKAFPYKAPRMKLTTFLQRAADNLAPLPTALQRGWNIIPSIYSNMGGNDWTHNHWQLLKGSVVLLNLKAFQVKPSVPAFVHLLSFNEKDGLSWV